MDPLRALPGGVCVAATTSPQVVDLSLFVGLNVIIFAPSVDVYFCASASSSDTAIVVTTNAASLSAYIADRSPAGFGKVRRVESGAKYMIVRTVSGTDNVTIKPV